MFAAGTPGGLVRTFQDSTAAGSAAFTLMRAPGPAGRAARPIFMEVRRRQRETFSALIAPTINAGTSGGAVAFYNTSTANHAAFSIGAKTFNAYFERHGQRDLLRSIQPRRSHLQNLPDHAASANGGFIGFGNTATADHATLIDQGGALGRQGGDIGFFSNSTAGGTAIQRPRRRSRGALGSSLRFNDTSTAGDATIMTLGSDVGGNGGYTPFFNSASGGAAAFITEGNGLFDISYLGGAGTTAGSIAGSGAYSLAKTLTVGGLRNRIVRSRA